MGTTLRGAVLVHHLIVSWDYCPVFLAQLSVSNPYSSHSPSWSQIWGKKKVLSGYGLPRGKMSKSLTWSAGPSITWLPPSSLVLSAVLLIPHLTSGTQNSWRFWYPCHFIFCPLHLLCIVWNTASPFLCLLIPISSCKPLLGKTLPLHLQAGTGASHLCLLPYNGYHMLVPAC